MSKAQDPEPPVSMDIGLGASAHMRLKLDIPAVETGRLVGALTDIIRPFTEGRGLKADRVRLQREDVLYQIALKARERAVVEKTELRALPLKLLVPFMEKASLEDIDNEMRDRWAALLLSASKDYQARQLTFVDMLSRLSSTEVQLLEDTCFAHEGFPETSYPHGHSDNNKQKVVASRHLLEYDSGAGEKAPSAYERFIEATQLEYGKVIYANVSDTAGGREYIYNMDLESAPFASLEILKRERLINIWVLIRFGIEICYFEVTRLGLSFVLNCAPRASEIVALRKNKTA